MEKFIKPRGRPRRLKEIVITVIDPGAYPEIASANDNRFARLPNTERLREFEEICAKVLAAATVERRWQKVKVEKLVNAA